MNAFKRGEIKSTNPCIYAESWAAGITTTKMIKLTKEACKYIFYFFPLKVRNGENIQTWRGLKCWAEQSRWEQRAGVFLPRYPAGPCSAFWPFFFSPNQNRSNKIKRRFTITTTTKKCSRKVRRALWRYRSVWKDSCSRQSALMHRTHTKQPTPRPSHFPGTVLLWFVEPGNEPKLARIHC